MPRDSELTDIRARIRFGVAIAVLAFVAAPWGMEIAREFGNNGSGVQRAISQIEDSIGAVAAQTHVALPDSNSRDSSGSAATDVAALRALYQTTGGRTWADSTNWLTGQPLGSWFGVTTDEGGRVTALELANNRLEGRLPPELGLIETLEVLNLGGNQLVGQIPLELEISSGWNISIWASIRSAGQFHRKP